MGPFWAVVISNGLLVIILAAGVALLERIWKNPLYLHLLWVLVLLKFVTPPVATIPVLSPPSQALPAKEERRPVHTQTAPSDPVVFQNQMDPLGTPREPDFHAKDQVVSEDQAQSQAGIAPVALPHEVPWLAIMGCVWGGGAMLLASVHTWRILRFRRLLRRSLPPSLAVLSIAKGTAKRLGLRRVPEIRMLPVCVSPMVWSLGGKPLVLLPTALFGRLNTTGQEAILAHELAHIQRRDHRVRLLEATITTLFWWHPVTWWAARRLQELEDQCCDAMVVEMAPNSAKNYATALLDTLDFLCERAIAAPLSATAAKSSTSLVRRIEMLKNRSWTPRWTLGRLMLLLAVAALPMAVAFGQKPWEAEQKPLEVQKQSPQPAVERRAINKRVKDFPEKVDLSTPESAFAAYERAWARRDAKAVWELGWYTPRQGQVEETQRFVNHDAGKDPAAYYESCMKTEIIEVATYREDLAAIISKLKFDKGAGRDPYSCRVFGQINGVWKNLGEDRLPSLEAARENFNRKKDRMWEGYVKARVDIKSGKPLYAGGDSAKHFAPIAPGEPLGISVEKADLMGRVEWAMMQGGRDITARKTIEWGDVEKDANGNRKIRYKFYATIWDKDVYIVNRVFTFDAKGNIVDMADVEGFPQKKVAKPVDVNTQAGMKDLVEDFFSKNFRDVTSRETIEWGEVTKGENGNSSIRYKYRARIWDKDTKIMNQVFTFDPKGNFVSVKNVEGFPAPAGESNDVPKKTSSGKQLSEPTKQSPAVVSARPRTALTNATRANGKAKNAGTITGRVLREEGPNRPY